MTPRVLVSEESFMMSQGFRKMWGLCWRVCRQEGWDEDYARSRDPGHLLNSTAMGTAMEVGR